MEVSKEQYCPKEQSNALLGLSVTMPFARSIVGQPGSRAVRFVFLRFLAIETYFCFDEPVLEPWRGLRLVFWRTPKRNEHPKGWYRWKGLVKIGNTYAVGRVHAEYRKDWKGNSRRAAEKHTKEETVFRRVPLSEFALVYHRSKHMDPLLRYGMLRVTEDHLKTHPEDVSVLLAYTATGELGGGAVFTDYPDIKSSHYGTSFLTPVGRAHSFGFAYIDWWYKHMLQKGLVWAEFGFMWQPGDPAGWKGSSVFKGRFNPTLYTYEKYLKVTF
jgi:hypothetical protein